MLGHHRINFFASALRKSFYSSELQSNREIVLLKLSIIMVLCTFQALMILSLVCRVSAIDELSAVPSDEHHIVELNSHQPYLAGFHVNTEDLRTREVVNATSITVHFQSVETDAFPEHAWLGGGMFVQAQDSRFLHIDYGFYMMLVKDATGRLFVDLGLHQTREFSPPIQTPPDELVYAYTWQLQSNNLSTPVTLSARWDKEGNVRYSISTDQANVTLISINIPSLPNCQNIIRRFYAGNVEVYHFPLSRYVNYFQFGIVSSDVIMNTQWVVSLKNPRMLRTGRVIGERAETYPVEKGWVNVDKAWTVQGDKSYLDSDWMWGGKSYPGVDAEALYSPSENRSEVLFSYTGRTLEPGTVLWSYSDQNHDNIQKDAQSLNLEQDSKSPAQTSFFSNFTLAVLISLFLVGDSYQLFPSFVKKINNIPD